MTSAQATLVERRTWLVEDFPFHSQRQSHLETIYTVGNGYMGVRGTLEEGYSGELVSALVHGIYNHNAGELVPDIVNLPNPLPILLEIDGEPFHMDKGKILGYRRTLNLKTATLTREVIWRNSKGVIVKLSFERFASLADEHLLVQRVTVRALTHDCTIKVRSWIDGNVVNPEGGKHWTSQSATVAPPNVIALTGKTNQSEYEATVASALVVSSPVKVSSTANKIAPTQETEFTVAKETAKTIVKFTAIHTSRDDGSPQMLALTTLMKAQSEGYDQVLAAHLVAWDGYWFDSDIQIEGDESAQKAFRFCMYHVLIASPRHDEHVSIGAKTLSGPGYKGHVFWDTELFMVPMLIVTQPKLARNLLMYRYNNLPGARNKAKKAGFEGAMFPWESTDTGEETTPQWTNPLPDGSRIRIWTGDSEQHISTDIAYAVMQYWGWTKDEAFFLAHGAEIVLDTAVFWGSRAEYNKDQDRFELTMQIGPDEYHDNINNSAFTNSMARWHLQTALKLRSWLLEHHPDMAKALLERLKIDETRINHWETVIDKMYIPRDAELGILEQFDGFLKLDKVALEHWQPRVTNYDSIVGHEAMQKTMVIKQADIVMLMSLLGDDFGSIDERKKNYDFYSKVVDHGSSLSPSTHAWVAARLGMIEEAYEMFIYAANIDLEDIKGNVRDGIHAAASGGVWEAIVFGFCGLWLDGNGGYKVDPHLPAHWKSVKFHIKFAGESKEIVLNNS